MKNEGAFRTLLFTVVLIFLQVPLLLGWGRDVEEQVLPNGLRVLLKEVHTSPIVSVWCWYNVGSRNERPGITGIAHLMEHMNFRGTEGISREEMKGLIDAMGGNWNGYTWVDETAYFETIPSGGLGAALRLEAERMWKSRLDPGDFEKERTVVISEFRGGENDPMEVLDVDVTAAAFKAHPYGWPTIGWISDLETISRGDLLNFYNTYYIPNNATLVVVGDFDRKYALEKIWEYFKGIPVGPTPCGLRTIEPEQLGERRVVIRKPGPAAYLMEAYHTPPVSDDDFVPLLILDSVLAGGESINLWNLDWYENASRGSVLYSSLIRKGLATSAGALLIPTKYPWLFYIYASRADGVSCAELEDALAEVVETLRENSLGEEELQRAKNQVLARYVYDSDSVTEQAHQLGFFSTIFRYGYLADFPKLVGSVTAEEVMRVAGKYLSPSNRTTGWFLPVGATPEEEAGAPDSGDRRSPIAAFRTKGDHEDFSRGEVAITPPDFSRIRPHREVLPNGLAVLALRNSIGPSVHIKATIRAGSAADPEGKGGLAALTSSYLLEGAGELSGAELARKIDFGGTEVSVDVDRDKATIDIDLLKENMDEVMRILGEIVMYPRFPGEALKRLKGEQVVKIREEEADEGWQADLALRKMIYPAGHPYVRLVLGTEEDVDRLGVDDVRAFHGEYYYPTNTSIAVVGDLSPTEVVEEAREVFGGWTGPEGPAVYKIPAVKVHEGPDRSVVTMEDKTQVAISMGHLGIDRSNPDYAAVQVMNNILGEFGVGGRLGERVREEMGFAYSIYGTFDGGIGRFPFEVSAGVAPEVVEETISTITGEVKKFSEDGPTEEELGRSKQNVLGSISMGMEENKGLADLLSDIEFYSLGLDFLQEFSSHVSGTTVEDIRRVAREYLDPGNLSVAVAGPVDNDLHSLKRADR